MTAYRFCQMAAFQGKTLFAGHHEPVEHRVGGLGVKLFFGESRIFLVAFRHRHINPSAFQLVEVNHHVGLLLVVGIEHHAHPVAGFGVSDDLLVSHRFDDVESHRVAAIERKEYQHRVGASFAGKTVERRVAHILVGCVFLCFLCLVLVAA